MSTITIQAGMVINTKTLTETPLVTELAGTDLVAVGTGDRLKHISYDDFISPAVGGVLNIIPSDVPTSNVNTYQPNTTGTYTNFSGIVVTTEDIESGIVQIRRVGVTSVFTKVIIPNGISKANLKESIINAGDDFSDDNKATSFPNSGYLDASGNPQPLVNFYHTDWLPIPEGATKAKVAVAGDLTIAFRNSSNVFISTLGVPGEQYDIVFDIPLGAAFWAYNSNGDFLPGGSEYATHPAYVVFDTEASKIPWLSVDAAQIEGSESTPLNGNHIGYFPNAGYIDSSGSVASLPGFYHTNKINIPSGATELKVSVVGDLTAAFYNAANIFISTLGAPGINYDRTISIPAGAAKVAINMSDAYFEGGASYEEHPPYLYFPPYEEGYKIASINPQTSYWKDKNIFWCGTSIPAGYPKSDQEVWSYANKTAKALQAHIVNVCVPNGVMRDRKYNGSPVSPGRALLRFSNTGSTVNYQNAMIDRIGTSEEPDLFVFNYDVNDIDDDATDFNLFDPTDPYAPAMPINSRNKDYFIGATNFVIDALKVAKPKARIAFITHFSEDSNATEQEYLRCIDILTALGRYWGAPILNLASKTQWVHKGSFNSIAIYNPDGIHPASLNTTESVDILAGICKEFIEEIR